MADRHRARSQVRTAVVWDVLHPALVERVAQSGRDSLDVLDGGGGTGGFAVPLAALGHRVTVVDPSPDALAALERRAAEAGVTARVRAVQGDASELLDRAGADSADVVLLHGVLEVVDDPAVAVAGAVAALREGGVLSVLAANRDAVVFHRALAGHFVEARTALTDPDGRWGGADPVPRRFSADALVSLVSAAGLRPGPVHGVRVLADLVPEALVEAEPGAAEALLDLESTVAGIPAFRALATQLHLLARG